MPFMTDREIEEQFRYQRPTPAAAVAHETITAASIEFAKVIARVCPDSHEAWDAIKHLVLARMLANAAIALNHDRLGPIPGPNATK